MKKLIVAFLYFENTHKNTRNGNKVFGIVTKPEAGHPRFRYQ